MRNSEVWLEGVAAPSSRLREVIGELKAVIAVRSNSMVASKSLKTWSGRRDSNPRRPAWEYALPLKIENLCAQGDQFWQLATIQFQQLPCEPSLNAVIAVMGAACFSLLKRASDFLANMFRAGAYRAGGEVIIGKYTNRWCIDRQRTQTTFHGEGRIGPPPASS